MSSVTELLKIDNFLSIRDFEWKVEDFNIITGDMGSGKSLCIKLLKFFEDIISDLLVLPYEQFLSDLEYSSFLERLIKEFKEVFYFESDDAKSGKRFNIRYLFSYESQKIEIYIKNDDNDTVSVESSFLEKLLQSWKDYVGKQSNITPDGFREVKLFLHDELQKTFGGHFPIATIFIPASRAALAFDSGSGDSYLKEYNELIKDLKRFTSRKITQINSILKAKIKEIDSEIWLESDDGRKVPISKASSGQQEIIYVLMLLDKLGKFRYSYGREQSLFIEEPSAHLFPLEQKQTIELIVQIFNSLKEEKNVVRFFITTHSPYILNSLNNILKKGSLIEKYSDKTDEIDDAVEIPNLFIKDVSAYFIDSDGIGRSMVDENEKYIYDDKIAEISYFIDEQSRKLSEMKNEFLNDEAYID
jgi:predicted ATPase